VNFTEEEAKNKVCPFAMNNNNDLSCAASYCMAWMWTDHREKDTDGERTIPIFGYCKLIGKEG